MPNRIQIYALAEKLGFVLLKNNLRCAVAESCTGGGLAAAITDVPGSSNWFERGFVTYSNQSKTDMLSVPPDLINKHGAVSEEVVLAMASGVIIHSQAQLSIAISGVAGPGGGTPDKPVGTVWIAWANNTTDAYAQHYLFQGNREVIRQQAVLVALEVLLSHVDFG